MRAIAHLALRLAVGRSGTSRRRSGTVAAATSVATIIVVLVVASARVDQAEHPERYADGGMGRFLSLAGLLVAFQLAALVGVAARAVANARSRGLANLRLLGLSPARTRAVAAMELIFISISGAAVGCFGSLAVAGPRLRGQLDPVTVAGCGVAVVALTAAFATPQERFGSDVRGQSARRPSWWRLAPLVLAALVSLDIHVTEVVGWRFSAVVVVVAATALGVMLAVPIFVRLVGDGLVHFGRGGVSMLAGRRLQTHPAAMNRVIVGLLLGLFVATGARFVVGAFESTPQYQGAAVGIEDRQLVEARVASADVPARIDAAQATTDVTDVLDIPMPDANCDVPGMGCAFAYIMSCTDLQVLVPPADGCREEVVTLVTSASVESLPEIDSVALSAGDAAVEFPVVAKLVLDNGPGFAETVFYLIPPGLPGVDTLAAEVSTHRIVVIGEPGRDLAQRLVAAGFVEEPSSIWGVEDYDFVDSLRRTVVGLTLLILGIGLVAYALATVDTIARRRHTAVAMQLVGVPPAVLRRVQLIETAVPTVGGAVLAVAAGILAGTAYVAEDGRFPVSFVAIVTSCAIAGGFVTAALAVLAANPKIEPGAIRRE